MAFVFGDSFSTYNTNGFSLQYWDGSLNNAPGAAGSGRWGGNSRSFAIREGYKDVPAQATYIAAFAINFGGVTGGTAFASFGDGATVHVDLHLSGSKIQARRGDGTVLATASKRVRAGVWYHIQFKVTVDNSSGVVEVRVDGSSSNALGIPSTTGLDTLNGGGSAQITRVSIDTAINNLDALFSDFALFDTTGAINNNFPGDCKWTFQPPTGNGTHADFTPSAGSLYQNVDDAAPDGDSTYNHSGTPGDQDSFTRAALTVTGSILAVQHKFVHRKDDAGLREIASLIRSGGNDFVGTTEVCGSSFAGSTEIYETDPNTSAPWVTADWNSAELGYKVIT